MKKSNHSDIVVDLAGSTDNGFIMMGRVFNALENNGYHILAHEYRKNVFKCTTTRQVVEVMNQYVQVKNSPLDLH